MYMRVPSSARFITMASLRFERISDLSNESSNVPASGQSYIARSRDIFKARDLLRSPRAANSFVRGSRFVLDLISAPLVESWMCARCARSSRSFVIFLAFSRDAARCAAIVLCRKHVRHESRHKMRYLACLLGLLQLSSLIARA